MIHPAIYIQIPDILDDYYYSYIWRKNSICHNFWACELSPNEVKIIIFIPTLLWLAIIAYNRDVGSKGARRAQLTLEVLPKFLSNGLNQFMWHIKSVAILTENS